MMATPKTKSPAKKPASKTAAMADPTPTVPADDTDARVFQQGRTAALGSISVEDAPYDKSDPNHAAWLKGHKSVTG